MKVGLFFYFHEDYRRYLMDELLNGRTNVPTHPTQITFLKTSLISFKSVMDGGTTSLPIKFLLHVFMFNLSINMILDNDNGLWQVTLWNYEYDVRSVLCVWCKSASLFAMIFALYTAPSMNPPAHVLVSVPPMYNPPSIYGTW